MECESSVSLSVRAVRAPPSQKALALRHLLVEIRAPLSDILPDGRERKKAVPSDRDGG
jgi:hypothetical protein